MQDPRYWRSSNETAKIMKEQSDIAHQKAFDAVCQVIDNNVLLNKEVMKLADLCQVYISNLQGTKFANPNYRAGKLKSKLEKHGSYAHALSFILVDQAWKGYLVYSSNIDIASAMKSAFKLGSIGIMQSVADDLRSDILSAFDESGDIAWPPVVERLQSDHEVIPSRLSTFLAYLISAQMSPNLDKTKRLVSSIGQDICRAVTKGRWKLPKHILLSMTLRHLYRSKELTTLINRFGHCENYDFSVEVETAIAKAVDQMSSLLTTQIIRHPQLPSLFHSEFDNFDQLVSNLSGQGSVHTAHGIMLQEIHGPVEEHGGTVPDFQNVTKTNERSFQCDPAAELPECYIAKRKSPDFAIRHWTCTGSECSMNKARLRQILWVLLRTKCNMDGSDQEIPGWSGFLSGTGKKPQNLTTIDYYPVINQPITEYKTVQQCLDHAEKATNEVGQKYVITTFDLGVCMKAYPIVCNNPDKYKNHIILIGTFHLTCAYLRMVGKKMAGSGIDDVFLEANLVGSGSLSGILNGKNYARSMHCHKVLVESLERLLLSKFAQGHQTLWSRLSDQATKLIEDFVASPSETSLKAIMEVECLGEYITDYLSYRDSASKGVLGKTCQLWLSYMDHIWLVLELQQAVKLNDLMLYSQCLTRMADLFFSFNGQNYARYLTYFSLFIANIETSHPGSTELLERGAISVARSFIPGNRCDVDKTMEETFMKHSKSHQSAGGSSAGLSGITTNYNAYQRWVRTAHERTKFTEETFEMVGIIPNSDKACSHKDLRQTEITNSEANVRKTISVIQSFVDPFSIDDTANLYNIASGAPVPVPVATDVLRAEQAGKDAKEAFIRDRLEKNEKFFDPIKRLCLKTMVDSNKSAKLKTSKNKAVEYKQQGNIALQLLVKTQDQASQVDLQELMSYPLTPVPYSIGTSDGFLAKTDKAKGFHLLTDDLDDSPEPPTEQTLVIEDGNASFHSIKVLPPNFQEIGRKLFEMVPNDTDFIFSTDMYKENSIKSMERARRGCGEKMLIKGEKTRKPSDWKAFLSNAENKKQLIALLLAVWGSDNYAQKLQNRQIWYICEGKAFRLSSEDGNTTETTPVSVLDSSQEETDSRVALYCKYGSELGYKSIRVRSPDSDIFFLLLYYAKAFTETTILFETGKGNNRRLLNVTEAAKQYTQQQCSALLGLHAFTGCDTCSAFKGIGKKKPIKLLQKNPTFYQVFELLGESWSIPDELFTGAEEFTCVLYGKPRFQSVNELRYHLLKAKCGNKDGIDYTKNVDIGTFPPCKDSLTEHVRRVNYQVAIWKQALLAQPEIPDPSDNHGWIWKENILEPKWTSGNILPQQIVDVLDEQIHPDDDDDDDDDGDSDFEGYIDNLDDESSDDE